MGVLLVTRVVGCGTRTKGPSQNEVPRLGRSHVKWLRHARAFWHLHMLHEDAHNIICMRACVYKTWKHCVLSEREY
jgi:arylsulfatase A-like enzyme